MTWEEKLAAIQALCETHIGMRAPGDWYVYAKHIEIGGNGMLESCTGNGNSPSAAVDAHWKKLTELSSGRYLVLNAMTERKHFRWNGFMWSQLPIEVRL